MNTKEIHEALTDSASFHIMAVTNTGSGARRRPGISLLADWLPDMGFIPGARVKALPAPDGGLDFNLCDDNIRRYSELDITTEGKDGKLIESYNAVVRQKESPVLAISGQILYDAGFSIGDALVAQYEYGLIHVRKLPYTARVIYSKSRTRVEKSTIKLTGDWLTKLGFVPAALLTVHSEKGWITYTVRDESIEQYSDLVRIARKNKMKLIEVKEVTLRGKRLPLVVVTENFLNNAGISASEPLLALCRHGVIKLHKPNMGF